VHEQAPFGARHASSTSSTRRRTAPLWGYGPLVVTIHDVSYARQPESPHPGGIGAFRQWFYRMSAVRATRIITDSTFSSGEITAAYAFHLRALMSCRSGYRRSSANPAVSHDPIILHVGDPPAS
jgi:hypothetical protein